MWERGIALRTPILSLGVCLLVQSLAFPAIAGSCRAANILFGAIRLDVIKYDDYETAIVRSDTFNDPSKNYGAILGELTVDRGGFAIRDDNQVVVGTISPNLIIAGTDEACNKKSVATIVQAKKGIYVILNNGRPVGTISGVFPKNDFGVK
jgi:hypothetical protein